MARILIIDDDFAFCKLLCAFASELAHDAECTHTIKDALLRLSATSFDVVYLDVRLPDGNGLDIISDIKSNRTFPEVVIITGNGERNGAEIAIQNGVWDYLKKPVSISKLALQLNGILKYREAKKRRKGEPAVLKRDGIIGESNEIKKCLNLVLDASKSDASVLIEGETGTGKELFAKAIHLNSRRRNKNFVAVDCGALTKPLVGSVLFGHKKGAFTGADQSHQGLIEQADKGTLFLDEAGELPLSIQVAFLRSLQEHKVRPVGSKTEISSDFRLITATNRDLNKGIDQGIFRKDLLYRLNTIMIDLPPLRKRRSDIKDLATYYIGLFCNQYKYKTKGYSGDFIEILTLYDWPGNIRELANALELAVCSAGQEDILYPIHLPANIRIQSTFRFLKEQSQGEYQIPDSNSNLNTSINLRAFLKETEKQYLIDLVFATRGSIKEICLISGLSRSALYERLKEYNIDHKF